MDENVGSTPTAVSKVPVEPLNDAQLLRVSYGRMMKLDIIQPCEGCFLGSNPDATT